MNPITGEKEIDIAGEKYILRFDWKALAEIEQRYGDSPNLFNAEVVSEVAAAGLRMRHPEMTAQKVMELSPPLVPLAHAVQQALQWAYFGPEAVPKEGVKKKHAPGTGGLWNRIARLFRRG
jgi:hypothetical protein